tara:strand:- start:1448 stop:1999 length:552 start_codon:yes stop_codon:yes gene_type:complete
MPSNSLYIPRNILRRGLANNSTDVAVSFPVSTTTEPSSTDSETPTANHAVIPTSDQDTLLHFFGTDTDDDDFHAYVYGWSRLVSLTSSTHQWMATFLIRVVAKMGTHVGLSGGIVTDSERWCDTITLDTTNIGTSDYEIISAADNGTAALIIRNKGFEKLDVWFDMNAGATAGTGCNVAWRSL